VIFLRQLCTFERCILVHFTHADGFIQAQANNSIASSAVIVASCDHILTVSDAASLTAWHCVCLVVHWLVLLTPSRVEQCFWMLRDRHADNYDWWLCYVLACDKLTGDELTV